MICPCWVIGIGQDDPGSEVASEFDGVRGALTAASPIQDPPLVRKTAAGSYACSARSDDVLFTHGNMRQVPKNMEQRHVRLLNAMNTEARDREAVIGNFRH